MSTYIAEIAGKDSIVSVLSFMQKNRNVEIVPTVVYTGTEYGDFSCYERSVDFLKREAEKYGVVFQKTEFLQNGTLWNEMVARPLYRINQIYSCYSMCVMCHLYTHIMRVPLVEKYQANALITGERFWHNDKQKENQHQLTISCFDRIFKAFDIRFERPLFWVKDTSWIDACITDENVRLHANDVKCVLSGNMSGFSLEEAGNLQCFVRYLSEYAEPTGKEMVNKILGGKL